MAAANVDFVQLDSLVVMKIVKHVETEQHTGMSEVAGEACQGFLTGLVAVEDHRLEITNCFPTARAEPTVDDEGRERQARDLEDVKQAEMLDMLRKFRNMNIDYELVGFYQAHPFGACFTADLVESLVDYQSSVVDGVVLIYDPVRTRQGQLSLRAYRLSSKALDLCYVDWSPETVKQAGLTFENMFEELPIIIKNSHLVNVMLSEMALSSTKPAEPIQLQLGTKGSLEKCMRSLMNHVDDLNRSINAYNKYAVDKTRHDALVSNLTQKRQLENESRRGRGEPPLPMDDIKKMKPPTLQAKNGMLECFLAASETNAHVDHALEVAGENIAKLFLAESVAEERIGKERSSSSVNVTSSSSR